MNSRPLNWIDSFEPEHLDEVHYRRVTLRLLDLLGVAAGASTTPLASIATRYVARQHGGTRPLLFANATASPTGVALHGAWMIDALDAHDGHALTKGHAGVALLPGLLALPEVEHLSGRAFLGLLVLGYEVATRAGIALHASVPDYHTSGAWNALGVAAVAGKLLGLDREALHEALGIAEFYGPRSQMMRCIDHPGMIKDGSGWGAMAGIAAALLARDGFTGSPAVTVVGDDVVDVWADLGERWYFLEQYVKPYPVCRWAQPAVEAVLSLRSRIPDVGHVAGIEIHSFHEAARLVSAHPHSTEQAQYSLPWPVACAVQCGTVDVSSVTTALSNPGLHDLADRVTVVEEAGYNAVFPAQRRAHAVVVLNDGTTLTSASFQARGDPTTPLSQDVIVGKYYQLCEPVLGDRAHAIHAVVENLERSNVSDLLTLLRRRIYPVSSTAAL